MGVFGLESFEMKLLDSARGSSGKAGAMELTGKDHALVDRSPFMADKTAL